MLPIWVHLVIQMHLSVQGNSYEAIHYTIPVYSNPGKIQQYSSILISILEIFQK